MSKRGHIPTSYDEIVHNTVPTLDLLGPTTPPPPLAEGELEARVRAALRADSRLADTQIDVIVYGSHVWLSGTAIGPGTVAYAAHVAKGVEGVTHVHNEIAVEPEL